MTPAASVDDDEVSNYIHSDLLTSLQISDHITTISDGLAALGYLTEAYKKSGNNVFFVPDIIFLDINMPMMNGFEFLEHFGKRLSEFSPKPRIYMLTTSLLQEEMTRAEKYKHLIDGYLEKPLSSEMVMGLL